MVWALSTINSSIHLCINASHSLLKEFVLLLQLLMMSSFLSKLSDNLQILFLSLWLDVRSLSTLDVAISCHRQRPCWMTLLTCLRSPAYDRTLPRGHKGSGGEGISMMSVMLISYEQGAKGDKRVSYYNTTL